MAPLASRAEVVPVLAELDAIETALGDAVVALAAAEPQVWRSPAARAYATRLAEVRERARRLRLGAEAARDAVLRLEAGRGAREVASGPLGAGRVGVPW